MYKKLQEIAEKKGKKLFIESFPISLNNIEKIEEMQEKKLVESDRKGESFEAIAVLKGVDVTRFIPNANKRLYPKKLWERVYKEGVAEGTRCYANHPEDDSYGDVTRLVGIWHDFKINEDSQTGKGDLYLIGKYGKLLLDAIKAGSRGEGFSSVGFGAYEEREEELEQYKELEEGIEIIEWDSYEIQRLADWVDSPSQEVYATRQNIRNANMAVKQMKESKRLFPSQKVKIPKWYRKSYMK